MNAAATTNTALQLEQAFRDLGALAPAGYPHWRELTEIGAAAAARGDLVIAKRVCSECHDQYRPRYRRELRGRALVPEAASPAAPAAPAAAAPPPP